MRRAVTCMLKRSAPVCRFSISFTRARIFCTSIISSSRDRESRDRLLTGPTAPLELGVAAAAASLRTGVNSDEVPLASLDSEREPAPEPLASPLAPGARSGGGNATPSRCACIASSVTTEKHIYNTNCHGMEPKRTIVNGEICAKINETATTAYDHGNARLGR